MINNQIVTPSANEAPPDWHQRVRHLREQQWALAQQLLASVRRTLAVQTQRLSPAEQLALADRLLRLAARLGSLSTQFSAIAADTDYQCPKCCAARLGMEAALAKVYGHPLPEEIPTAPSQPSTLNSQPSTNL
jgi:hypothetical protein